MSSAALTSTCNGSTPQAHAATTRKATLVFHGTVTAPWAPSWRPMPRPTGGMPRRYCGYAYREWGRMRMRSATALLDCSEADCVPAAARQPPGTVLALDHHGVAELRVGIAAAATKPAGRCGERVLPAPEWEPGGSDSAWGSDRMRAASGALPPPPLTSTHLQRLEQRSHEGCVRDPPSSPPITPPAAPGAAIA